MIFWSILRKIDSITLSINSRAFDLANARMLWICSIAIFLVLPTAIMKKILLSFALISSTLLVIRPAQAQLAGQNNVGASVIFGNGQTSLGIDSKFGLSDNLSVRPNVYFPNNTTTFGAALTYDFPSVDTERRLTPFGGVGVRFNSGGNNNNTTAYLTAGADYNLDSSIVLKANLSVPISSNDSTTVAVGGGLRF